jgi:hypothetical protein
MSRGKNLGAFSAASLPPKTGLSVAMPAAFPLQSIGFATLVRSQNPAPPRGREKKPQSKKSRISSKKN